MTRRKHTPRTTTHSHIHIGTRYYAPLAKAPYAPTRLVPYIRLTGQWLTAAGFSAQDRLAVTLEPGRIILTRV